MSLPATTPPNAYLLDTNSLLGFATPHHHNAATTRPALIALEAAGARLCVTPQVLIEFYAVATRDRPDRGLGWTPQGATKAIAALVAKFEMLDDAPAVFAQWQKLTTAHKVKGKSAHDTRLAAVALAHGVPALLTSNTRHFARFAKDGLTATDPTAVTATQP